MSEPLISKLIVRMAASPDGSTAKVAWNLLKSQEFASLKIDVAERLYPAEHFRSIYSVRANSHMREGREQVTGLQEVADALAQLDPDEPVQLITLSLDDSLAIVFVSPDCGVLHAVVLCLSPRG